ncbi:glycosyltransferase [Sanguibacter massiliensis]|uniref:glycosyltransferase n=1 Tax=Sanguibacter massiliensis TaxID=1973217 RepID=UPI000C85CAF0|nr:glycosyltransferase [Sanguibacter massiliensis]
MTSTILVHEWLARRGGSENVYMALSEALPEADLLCLWNDDPDRLRERDLQETWLARTPLRRSKVAALPFIIPTWRRRRGDYSRIIVSSHLFAHHVSFRGSPVGARKFVYVHTPARYIWTPELDERGSSLPARIASAMLRPYDRRRAREPWSIAANSAYVQQRVRDTWGREAVVIHPPVDVERIQATPSWRAKLNDEERSTLDALPAGFILGASRFVEYKRLDRVIEIGEAAQRPVVLAGGGPLAAALAEQASTARVPVTIIAEPSDAMLFALYEAAAAFVFPPVEDFGIMPVEAHAAGCPTLVHDVGGAQESTTEGVSGAVVDIDSADDIVVAALERAIALDRDICKQDARRFSRASFATAIHTWIDTAPRSASTTGAIDR